MNRFLSSAFVILIGLLLILVPTYILPVCSPTEIMTSSHDHHITYKFMKCHWTSQAEIGIGTAIVVIGLIMLLTKSTLIRLGLNISLLVIAMFVAAVPTVLIGVCPGEMMACHIGTLPALLLLSGALFIGILINVFYLKRLS